MHEGDHSILEHDHGPAPRRAPSPSRVVAAAVVAAAVVLFLAWRLL